MFRPSFPSSSARPPRPSPRAAGRRCVPARPVPPSGLLTPAAERDGAPVRPPHAPCRPSTLPRALPLAGGGRLRRASSPRPRRPWARPAWHLGPAGDGEGALPLPKGLRWKYSVFIENERKRLHCAWEDGVRQRAALPRRPVGEVSWGTQAAPLGRTLPPLVQRLELEGAPSCLTSAEGPGTSGVSP